MGVFSRIGIVIVVDGDLGEGKFVDQGFGNPSVSQGGDAALGRWPFGEYTGLLLGASRMAC